MTQNELIEELGSLLRLAIASRLNIPKSDYDVSLDTRTAVNRCLSNVMALGYNSDIEAATKEICDSRFFGEDLDDATMAEIRMEIIASKNSFTAEVAFYAKAHELLRLGISPDQVLKSIQPLIRIDDAYKT